MISLCMIVRDEEEVIERCLKSAEGLFDEIIIADTGSKDSTKELCRKYTDKVYDFDWVDDFSAARNFAFSKASGEYNMWLDADDVIEGENRALLKGLIASLGALKPDMVMLPYNVAFDESGGVALSYDRERIVRAGLRFVGAIHEAIPPSGRIIRGAAAISHRKTKENEPGRNLRIFEKLLAEGKELSPREEYYFARELFAAGRLSEAKERYRSCAKDPNAWAENRISAYFELSQLLWSQNLFEKSDSALLSALGLGAPRADLCCEMGRRFFERGDLESAKFWYELAPKRFNAPQGGFVFADFGGYIPYLQLCAICDRLGQTEEAENYNRLAEKIKPNGAEVVYNRKYFENLRRKDV